MSLIWDFIVITGGSRGFGRAIASVFTSIIQKDQKIALHFLLTGRTHTDLEESKNFLFQSVSKEESSRLQVDLLVADLSSNDLPNIADDLFGKPIQDAKANGRSYARLIFINNAGSLGPLRLISSVESFEEIKKVFDLNVLSSSYLTAQVVGRYSTGVYSGVVSKLLIINISSLAAIQPFESWGYYCAGKAARDMFHRVVAVEHANDGVTVLNYAPGPLDTEMQREIRECQTVKEETREYYKSLKDENKLVDPNASAKKLLRLVETGLFESGSHVDYFDVIKGIDVSLGCNCTTPCSCGATCECVVTETTASANATGCGSSTCTCGSDCECAPGTCSCGAVKANAVKPTCKAAEACTCSPTCDCKETGRPCCTSCTSYLAAKASSSS